MESAAGFLCLLSVSVVWGQYSSGFTCTPTYTCATEGSTVEMRCTYTYSFYGTIEKSFWFTEPNRLDLRTDSEYSDRVQYHCQYSTCMLRITDLRLSDSRVYTLRLITNQQRESYIGERGVILSVTDLKIERSNSKLWCKTRCSLPDYRSYIWYKNGEEVPKQTSSYYSKYLYSPDSLSCALREHKNFPSPSKCADVQSCYKVTYSNRSICAPQGSSVDISCTYTSVGYITSKFWFRSERRRQWQNPSQPEDLSKDSQYSGRVQVFETDTGRSTLTITDLRETDSAQYHFKFITQSFEWRSSLPGTTLTVTALRVHVTKVSVGQSHTEAELKCHNSCSPAAHISYVWFKNEKKILGEVTSSYKTRFYHKDRISCALNGFEQHKAPAVYAPEATYISVSSAKIMEGNAVTLTCSSDANPPANYIWYKEGKEVQRGPEGTLHLTSITSKDKVMYNCTSENQFGQNSTSVFIDVQYPPKLPSVSVSPSAEIVEGSSVTLTCSSDANPAANYTWFKENQTLYREPQGFLWFSSISPEDSGKYYCKSENQYGKSSSSPVDLDVHYPPQLPSVSVSPSAEILEGSSVNLTCSSDANPAANYTWYKENEDSPKASGQIFTITDFRPEHSGNYYCEAQNTIGRQNSTLHLSVASGSMKSAAAGSITVVILVLIFLLAFLWIRKRNFFKNPPRPGERPGQTEPQNVGPEYDTVHREPAEQQQDLLYTSVIFSKIQEDPLYSNIRTAQLKRDEEEDVDYTVVKSESSTPSQGSEEDPSGLYSTVSKNHRT